MVNGQPTLTTVEHEYQAQKFELAFHDPAYAAHIRSIPVNHPKQAKHAGGQGGWITSKHGSIMIGGKTPCGRTVSNVGRRPPSKHIQTSTQGLLQDNNIQALDQQVCPNNDGVAV